MSFTQEELDYAVKTARAEGATAERQRIAGIMQCDAAKDRPIAAKQIAMATTMSAEDAAIFLAGMPAERRMSGGYRNFAEMADDQIAIGAAAEAAAQKASLAGLPQEAQDQGVDQINHARSGDGFTAGPIWEN
ncbi:hypothetical protein [Paracoccus sp. SY]|uniref:hypothetical protein n=1 Tax=Paracoccus sp. SY TaxID=1330255 RepID=UPI000CD112BF|nr:hypothetical protein [Paracoccus sp. SY]